MENFVSVCILTLARESLYKTLSGIFQQKFDYPFEVILIVQGSVDRNLIEQLNPQQIPFSLYFFEKGKGFGFYRNQAILNSKGDIISFIDDDEQVQDDYWLHYLTGPIITKKASIVTAGCKVNFTNNYLTNSLSILGYPGGGALGFSSVWKVFKNGFTNHLCGGNFAASKSFLARIGYFNENVRHSCDDTFLSFKILSEGTKIFYEPKATLIHPPRKFSDIYSWQLTRTRGAHEFFAEGGANFSHLRDDKIHHIFSILKYCILHPFRVPGVAFVIFFIIFLGLIIRIKKIIHGS